MPYLAQQRNTADSDVNMKQVRKPVFIDNALHLGEVAKQGNTKAKVTVKKRKSTSYAIASSHSFTIDEREDNIVLKHTATAGHAPTGSIFYLDKQLTGNDAASNIPPLLYSIEQQTARLSLGSSSSGTEGTTFAIRNMNGKTLNELGFSSTKAYAAQPIDVGFRTTDMALRLGKDIADTMTSVNIALPLTPINSNDERRKHSTRFVATDFYGVNLITALRYLGRHDNHITYFDRFGNFLYVPFNFSEAGRLIDANNRSGPSTSNPINNTNNKIAVQGIPLAVNDTAYAVVNDAERQSGRGADVQEDPQVITDFTVRNNEAARRVARSILKANSLLSGSRTSAGHPQAWDLRPGKIIEYEGKRRILTEVRHNLAGNTADLVFLTVETGIEGILQGILEGTEAIGTRPVVEEQIKEENLSLFADIEIITVPIIKVQEHGFSGFIIGRAMNRGKLGGSNEEETIGGSKSTPIIYRGDN
jgi:hypothetical protein